jgi:hypothetical protein
VPEVPGRWVWWSTVAVDPAVDGTVVAEAGVGVASTAVLAIGVDAFRPFGPGVAGRYLASFDRGGLVMVGPGPFSSEGYRWWWSLLVRFFGPTSVRGDMEGDASPSAARLGDSSSRGLGTRR